MTIHKGIFADKLVTVHIGMIPQSSCQHQFYCPKPMLKNHKYPSTESWLQVTTQAETLFCKIQQNT